MLNEMNEKIQFITVIFNCQYMAKAVGNYLPWRKLLQLILQNIMFKNSSTYNGVIQG